MAGPFKILEGVRSKKAVERFLILFTCLTSRATHIEIAIDQRSPSFLNCLLRMVARQGGIAHLFVDNSKNFVGVEKKLGRLLAQRSIRFHYIYPRSPNWGGSLGDDYKAN